MSIFEALTGGKVNLFKIVEVPESAELLRVAALPKRPPAQPTREFCEHFTRLLSRVPPGHPKAWVLNPAQVWALTELADCGGLFAPIPVGGGKTAICFLAPVMVRAQRTLFLVPASLRDDTAHEFRRLSTIFYGPKALTYKIESYQKLSTATAADFLEKYKPDLIVCDEAQHLRNPQAAATRRLRRYLDSAPETRFAALSGTLTKRSILDYYHLISWALREGSPLPRPWVDAQPWAQALDEIGDGPFDRRVRPGALVRLCETPTEAAALSRGDTNTARTVFRARLLKTRGVVSTQNTLTLPLRVDATPLRIFENDGVTAWEGFREEWLLPDGTPLVDGLELTRHAREMALGFFYKWRDKAPDSWLKRRKEWGRFVRETLKHSGRLDTELQVLQAIKAKSFGRWAEGEEIYNEWASVKNEFIPETVAEWLSDRVLHWCANWIANNPRGIVWVDHTAFGQRLEAISGAPYFGPQGLDKQGRAIASFKGPAIASFASSGTGRNLQWWHTNLLTAPPPTGARLEQVLGRTHRLGTVATEVRNTLLLNCFEHLKTFWRSVGDCEYTQATTGLVQRISGAVVDVPEISVLDSLKDRRWG